MEQLPASALLGGLKNEPTGTHGSRTIMLKELQALLNAEVNDSVISGYRNAIVEMNILQKATVTTRRESFRRLQFNGFDAGHGAHDHLVKGITTAYGSFNSGKRRGIWVPSWPGGYPFQPNDHATGVGRAPPARRAGHRPRKLSSRNCHRECPGQEHDGDTRKVATALKGTLWTFAGYSPVSVSG